MHSLSFLLSLRLALAFHPDLGLGLLERQRQPQRQQPYRNSHFLHAVKSLATSSKAVELKWADFSKNHEDAVAVPVVLLHGLLGSKRNFATIAGSLASQLEQKRRIIGLDLRNHGENHHDWRDGMAYREMAADVLLFMDSQGLDKVVLVGHSVGGKVAQMVALLEPERIEGLVVIDIAPVTYTTQEPHWRAVHDIVEVLNSVELTQSVTKRDVDLQLRDAVPDPALRAFLLTNLDVATGCWKIHLEGIAAQMEELAGFDIDPLCHSYPGDVFFIHGGQSRFVRHAYMDSIAAYFPNHMLTTIRGVGHWVHAEAPDDTAALLKRFLDR